MTHPIAAKVWAFCTTLRDDGVDAPDLATEFEDSGLDLLASAKLAHRIGR